jgi:hypothetical protein
VILPKAPTLTATFHELPKALALPAPFHAIQPFYHNFISVPNLRGSGAKPREKFGGHFLFFRVNLAKFPRNFLEKCGTNFSPYVKAHLLAQFQAGCLKLAQM